MGRLATLSVYALLSLIAACGGGGGGVGAGLPGDPGLAGVTGASAEPRPQYQSLAAQIPDTGGFLHLGNSALWGQTLPVMLAGVQERAGVVEGVRGGADVTLVDATTLDVQIGGETVRFTYNATTFRFEDGQGAWFNAPQPPLALTVQDPGDGGLFLLAGGFAPVTLPNGMVRYTGTSDLLVIPQGATDLGAVRQVAGQADLSVDFANGVFAGEGFRGQADLTGAGPQSLTISVGGSVTGSALSGQVTGVSVPSGALVVGVTGSEVEAQVLENGGAKLVGTFGAEVEVVAGGSGAPTLIGAFRGFK